MLPQRDYRQPIIEILGAMGGSATKQDVISRLEVSLGQLFDDEDWEPPPSRPNESNWSNRASWERNSMVGDGLLVHRDDGVWQLAPLGFERFNQLQSASSRRNPDWAIDELILALDLYLRLGLLDDRHSEVRTLSRLLNALPIHSDRPDVARFRNPNGVALKLANFAAIDPSYDGVGMTRGSRRDHEVWDHFVDNRDELHEIAERLRAGADAGPDFFPVEPVDDEDGVMEGRLLFRQHRARERNRRLVERKKQQVLASVGALACEVCGFDFRITYGERGDGFIECHHIRPLAESGLTQTRQADLALLCANCHRMVHRYQPWPSMSELRELLTAPV